MYELGRKNLPKYARIAGEYVGSTVRQFNSLKQSVFDQAGKDQYDKMRHEIQGAISQLQSVNSDVKRGLQVFPWEQINRYNPDQVKNMIDSQKKMRQAQDNIEHLTQNLQEKENRIDQEQKQEQDQPQANIQYNIQSENFNSKISKNKNKNQNQQYVQNAAISAGDIQQQDQDSIKSKTLGIVNKHQQEDDFQNQISQQNQSSRNSSQANGEQQKFDFGNKLQQDSHSQQNGNEKKFFNIQSQVDTEANNLEAAQELPVDIHQSSKGENQSQDAEIQSYQVNPRQLSKEQIRADKNFQYHFENLIKHLKGANLQPESHKEYEQMQDLFIEQYVMHYDKFQQLSQMDLKQGTQSFQQFNIVPQTIEQFQFLQDEFQEHNSKIMEMYGSYRLTEEEERNLNFEKNQNANEHLQVFDQIQSILHNTSQDLNQQKKSEINQDNEGDRMQDQLDNNQNQAINNEIQLQLQQQQNDNQRLDKAQEKTIQEEEASSIQKNKKELKQQEAEALNFIDDQYFSQNINEDQILQQLNQEHLNLIHQSQPQTNQTQFQEYQNENNSIQSQLLNKQQQKAQHNMVPQTPEEHLQLSNEFLEHNWRIMSQYKNQQNRKNINQHYQFEGQDSIHNAHSQRMQSQEQLQITQNQQRNVYYKEEKQNKLNNKTDKSGQHLKNYNHHLGNDLELNQWQQYVQQRLVQQDSDQEPLRVWQKLVSSKLHKD